MVITMYTFLPTSTAVIFQFNLKNHHKLSSRELDYAQCPPFPDRYMIYRSCSKIESKQSSQKKKTLCKSDTNIHLVIYCNYNRKPKNI